MDGWQTCWVPRLSVHLEEMLIRSLQENWLEQLLRFLVMTQNFD